LPAGGVHRMSTTIQIGDKPVTVGDFSAFKFLEALALVGEIMEAVPLADEKISEYTKQWLTQNGSEQALDRASARWLFGRNEQTAKWLEAITDAEWEASGQKLRLAKEPDGNAAFMRAFPSVYKHARKQTENLICLIATPNSDLEKADAKGEADHLYEQGGPVHEMRELILHRAKLPDQMRLVLGSLKQLAEEMQQADLGAQMGEFRAAVKALATALGVSDDRTGPGSAESSDESESTAQGEPASEPSSSTPSSPAIPASPEPTSSTASATAN
jgi:hypothetical protein